MALKVQKPRGPAGPKPGAAAVRGWLVSLPRRISPGERCVAVSQDGQRCRASARIEDTYHGDNELYDGGDRVGWVRIAFCEKHFKSTFPHDPLP